MKILVADDSLVMRRLLESIVDGWGYEVLSARDGGEAWAVLSQPDAPQIAILDWMMPVYTGLELCAKVRELHRKSYTYIILLTSRGLRQDIVEGLSAGADDYVVKPFEKQELEVRLRAGRRIIDLQAELVAAQAALMEQATRDALTKIWNRASILEALDREVIRSHREKSGLGVLMIDLDHFKLINDSYGHQAGDEALRETARRMQAAIRPYDSLGRYGGEEFLMVVPGCDDLCLSIHAERLRLVMESEPFLVAGREVCLTASFGASSISSNSEVSAEELIRSADAALYEAKRAGRNRVVLAGSLAR
ncbi:MAG TPA: diguanylate cyclase [Paludibaculum sp.]